MNLRQLEIFRAIMTQGSVSEAARSLHVSQPSVSNVLKHAEQSLGVQLFERIAGRLLPTPEAELLFPEVEQIYDQLARIDNFVRDLRSGSSGRLSLIANPTLANTLLPLAIARFRELFANVRVRLQTDIPASQIAERIVRREFDLGFAYGSSLDAHNGAETIGRSSLALALPKTHKLARKRKIGPRDLDREPLISFGAGAPIRTLAEAVFADAGRELIPVVEASFSAAACVLAQQGAGIAIVDRLVLLTESFPGVVIRPLDTARTVGLELISPANRPHSLLSRKFADILRAVARGYERDHLAPD